MVSHRNLGEGICRNSMLVLVESKRLEESAHQNLRPAGVAAVEAESHHVCLVVHETFAVLVIEV